MHTLASIDATSWFVYSLVQAFREDLVSSLIVIVVAAMILLLSVKIMGWLWNKKWKMFEDSLHALVMVVLMLACMAGALVMNSVTGGGLLSADTGVLTSAIKLANAPDKVQWVQKAAGMGEDPSSTAPALPTRRPTKAAGYSAEDTKLAQQIVDLNEYENGKVLKMTEGFVKEAANSVTKAFNLASSVMILSFVLLLAVVSWSAYGKIVKISVLENDY